MSDKVITAYASLILILLVFPCVRLSAASMETHEKTIIASYSRGDYKTLADSLSSMLTEHPLDPVSVVHYGMLFRMAELLEPGSLEKTALMVKEKLLGNNGEDAASCRIRINCELEQLLYRTKGSQGGIITGELKPVRKWTLYGPYHRYGAADIDFRFQPELIVSGSEISPQKRITITESDGWLDPDKYLYTDSGVMYATVSFSTRIPVKLRMYSDASYKVFVNGHEAVRNLYHGRRAMRLIRVRSSRNITVTVKMIGSPFKKFRMLVTDEHNALIEPDIIPGSSFLDECDVTEELDYPYDALVKDAAVNPGRGNRHLGLFFNDLKSNEAAVYFQRSLSEDSNAFSKYLLASCLIDRNKGDQNSAGYNRGLFIINSLREGDAGFIPAWQEQVEHYIRKGLYLKAFQEGKRLVAAGPGNPYGLAAYLTCLKDLSFDKEFEDTAEQARKRFPDFIPVLEAETEYYMKRDSNRFMQSSLELIRRKFTVPGLRALLRHYLSRGEYQPALNLIQAYNFNNDFNHELIEILIRKGDLTSARGIIFKQIVMRESPFLYNSLALIDMLQSEDPSMYLQKALALQPSLFSISDYLNYLEQNDIQNPFSRFLDRTEPIGASLLAGEYGSAPSTILYRGRIFLFNKDGSSRLYCEDIVHVANEAGVRRWRNIGIPYSGRIRPIHLNVHDNKGKRTDSDAMVNLRMGRRVTFSSLGKNSIIHLSYIVDNPAVTFPESRFFSVPLEYLHHYDEPVRKVSIKIIAPEGMGVYFIFKDKVTVKKSLIEGRRVHEAVIENIPAVKKDICFGGKGNCLHYYSFSTMDGFADFSAWYRGIMLRTSVTLTMPVTRFRKDTLEKTIKAVYDFVAREIKLSGKFMYAPESVEDTIFKRSGTPEDKVLLAQTLLKRLGISSYIAFARNRTLPGSENCLYRGHFTHILLCVPLDADNALWLDFSGRDYRCGATDRAIAGTDALVLLYDSYSSRRVQSLDTP